ncbi:MAG: hypothetical protein AAGG02_04550 [Cyanobacteria bacterium P01_H01_bin.15]
MDPFSPHPPSWTETAKHAVKFTCPRCGELAANCQQVWINRRAPVLGEDRRRRWQEFYACECGQAWWAWSTDRPPRDVKETSSLDG